MLSGVTEFVIQGITVDGNIFQQPDWSTNLCGMLATTGSDGRLIFSPYARPVMVDGVHCVVINIALQYADFKAFEMVRQFVAEHRLKVRSGRGGRDAEATGGHPVIRQERRSPQNNNW